MRLAQLPRKISGLPNWIVRNLGDAIPSTLTIPLMELWLGYIYEHEEFVIDMEKPTYEVIINSIARSRDIVEEFLMVLYFVRGMIPTPSANWTYTDYISLRSEALLEIKEELAQALAQLSQPRPPAPGYTPISPNLPTPPPTPRSTRRPSAQPSTSVISHRTIPPAILDPMTTDDPSPLNPGGDDEVSVDPSLPEFNMESEMAQMHLDQTSIEGPKSNHSVGTRTLKSIYASARKTRSEEFKRHNSPPKLRSKTSVDKMR